jgi:hypothetical protein
LHEREADLDVGFSLPLLQEANQHATETEACEWLQGEEVQCFVVDPPNTHPTFIGMECRLSVEFVSTECLFCVEFVLSACECRASFRFRPNVSEQPRAVSALPRFVPCFPVRRSAGAELSPRRALRALFPGSPERRHAGATSGCGGLAYNFSGVARAVQGRRRGSGRS